MVASSGHTQNCFNSATVDISPAQIMVFTKYMETHLELERKATKSSYNTCADTDNRELNNKEEAGPFERQ